MKTYRYTFKLFGKIENDLDTKYGHLFAQIWDVIIFYKFFDIAGEIRNGID